MNTLYIHDRHIDLIGFDKLSDKAYFMFRNGGLAISSIEMGVTHQKEIKFLDEKQILDKQFSDLLILYGFLNSHSFIENGDVYYCNFPDVPNLDREELLKQHGLSFLFQELNNN